MSLPHAKAANVEFQLLLQIHVPGSRREGEIQEREEEEQEDYFALISPIIEVTSPQGRISERMERINRYLLPLYFPGCVGRIPSLIGGNFRIKVKGFLSSEESSRGRGRCASFSYHQQSCRHSITL